MAVLQMVVFRVVIPRMVKHELVRREMQYQLVVLQTMLHQMTVPPSVRKQMLSADVLYFFARTKIQQKWLMPSQHSS